MQAKFALSCALLLVLAAVSFQAAVALDGFDPGGAGPGYPESACGDRNDKPSLPAHRIDNGGITVDGRLNESDWISAPAATGFSQFSPDRLGQASELSVFKVLYDEDAIYFGVANFRQNGTATTSCLSRRDHITMSDRVRIYIDPYHDKCTGYHFRINPDGVKEDYYNYGDLYHDRSWDAVWEADTYIDEEGWYAEIRIPFSSVRYRAADSMTWGFNVFTYIHALAEKTAWSNWDREEAGFMSQCGTITGIKDIRSPRQLEVTPYVVGRTLDPADPSASGFGDEEWDNFFNFGADIKYGVTSDLTLNATFQPDFGQVEADPSVLNLSPYETYYDEKRPFFIEGAQFFWHPDNTVFYSRRIGTGSENSRIRAAAKLTGKITGDISTAVLVATTDETEEGKAHNSLKDGSQKTLYAIGRFGKQFHNQMHSINVMQTAVVRDRSSFDYATRNGYTTGADFELNFSDRKYQLTGSFVGSMVDGLKNPNTGFDPKPSHGTGTRFEFEKRSGSWTYAVTTRHQSDKLDINDFGYISDPNHYAVQVWADKSYNADDESSTITYANVNARIYKSWIYADRTVYDPANPDQELWSYKRGHDLRMNYNLSTNMTWRNSWGAWAGGTIQPETTTIYETRWTPDYSQRGPLMRDPSQWNAYIGCHSDGRKDYSGYTTLDFSGDSEGSSNGEVEVGIDWNQGSRIRHGIEFEYGWRHADAQWIGNVNNPGGGIGDVSYVFGEMDQQTWDLTWRSSVLFNRDQSLELYLQPFITVGEYANARELATPDSYDLKPYEVGGEAYDPTTEDFTFGAINVNMVYRWEYRPGSTLYLVWTHARENYDQRSFHDGTMDPSDGFDNDFSVDPLFDTEAENRFLLKVSYWFSI
jgi:Domain of unknown function (DUF5916)